MRSRGARPDEVQTLLASKQMLADVAVDTRGEAVSASSFHVFQRAFADRSCKLIVGRLQIRAALHLCKGGVQLIAYLAKPSFTLLEQSDAGVGNLLDARELAGPHALGGRARASSESSIAFAELTGRSVHQRDLERLRPRSERTLPCEVISPRSHVHAVRLHTP